MAFHVAYKVGNSPTHTLGADSSEIRWISHCCFCIVIIVIPPEHHSKIWKHYFFVVGREMFENDISIWLCLPDLGSHSFKNCNPGSIISTSFAGSICKAFGEVKTESINFIFCKPVSVYPINKLLGRNAFMIEVGTKFIRWIRRFCIKPGIWDFHIDLIRTNMIEI